MMVGAYIKMTTKRGGILKNFLVIFLIFASYFSLDLRGEEEKKLDDLEIRVVRPRFVDKARKFEFGVQFNTILNQDFVNIFMGSALFQYHIVHSFGVELGGSIGLVLKDTDYEILTDKLYKIDLKRVNPFFLGNLGFNWSPFYGKFQVFSGSLLYFDTFFSFGGGVTGIQLPYDHCLISDEEKTLLPQTYIAWSGRVGLGQHFFINQNHAIRWDFKYNMFMMDSAQGACNPENVTESYLSLESNFMIKIGYSFFL